MQDARHDEPGHIRNYDGLEAIKKLKELAEGARTCMFTTFSTVKPLNSRPMALQAVDDDGTLHFFSAASSNKNKELEKDEAVQLFFANNGSSEYLSIFGNARISQDLEKIKALWSKWAKIWFQEGPDDPNLTLISVKPEESAYWDTKHNRMVALFKMAGSLITGKTMDDAVEGKLSVK